MLKENTKFDVAVIGAGPAGIMAAGKAASLGLKVVLVEKNHKIGKKLLLTGNGRCNLTNAEFDLKELVKNYNNGEFLFHVFSVFGPKETISFFEKLGVETKIENGKRVFPKSDDAQEILLVFQKYLEKNNVKILYNSEVADIVKKGKKITRIILKNGEVTAKKYVLAMGGKSHPLTGSDGLGLNLAEKLGHTIVKPAPALAPIKLKEEWAKNLQGISLKDTKVSVLQNGKKQFQEEGEILFTHFGISGPVILDISGKVGELLEGHGVLPGNVKICFDLFPLLNQEELLRGLEDILKKYPRQTIKNILSSFVPERLAGVLSEIAGIDKNKIANNMAKAEKEKTVKILKNFEVTPEDILGFDNSKVTRGGISLKEIDHKTMKSKVIDNLFFAGEIINIDGKTGGFNLQVCWSTGYCAGQNV